MSCTFCFRLMGRGYRVRSIDNVMNEINYLVHNYKINELNIFDDMFSADKPRVLEFCKRIKAYNIRWSCQLRVNIASEELLKAMKDSGCYLISYGFESGSGQILKSMEKNITVEMIENAVNLTKKNKIEIQGNFIFGDPAETIETMKITIKFIKRVFKTTLVWIGFIVPYPGTILYEKFISRGQEKCNAE